RFERELHKLFHRRTSWLRNAVGKKRLGRPPIFNRRKVEPKLDQLSEIAAQIVVRRRARRDLLRAVDGKRQWHVKRGKGFGVDVKKQRFKRWYDRRIGNRNCVYAFWSKKGCVYVGRTLRGHGRPAGWFDRIWF